jgi:hypothetical protein
MAFRPLSLNIYKGGLRYNHLQGRKKKEEGRMLMTTTLDREQPKNSISFPITPVDERRFDTESRRLTSEIENIKKSQEKSETRVEKKLDELKQDMNTRFEKTDAQINGFRREVDTRFEKIDTQINEFHREVNTRFEKIDGQFNEFRKEMNDRLWWIMGAVVFSILLPVALKYF